MLRAPDAHRMRTGLIMPDALQGKTGLMWLRCPEAP
jgi:hypothetical protein